MAAAGIAFGGLLAAPASAKVFLSQEEALALAFPEADRSEKKTHVLGAQQVEEIQRRARARLESKLVSVYSGWQGEELLGYAFIDVHLVRTKPEALLVVLGPAGELRSVRVLAFHEPLDYLPTERWYGQFEGKPVDAAFRVGHDIHGIMGATLSARATADAVRRCLAYYEVLVRPAQASSEASR
jgi:transcriptional regulator of nitric oxide reductase